MENTDTAQAGTERTTTSTTSAHSSSPVKPKNSRPDTGPCRTATDKYGNKKHHQQPD